MKKIILLSGIVCSLFAACDTNDELVLHPERNSRDSFYLKSNDSIKVTGISDSLVHKTDSVAAGNSGDSTSVPAPTPAIPVLPPDPAPVVPALPSNPDPVPAPVPDPAPAPVDNGTTATNDLSKFDIIFSHNFNKNTNGKYLENEWKIDWNSPSWADNAYGYGKIIQQGSNKYMDQSFVAGSFKAIDGYSWQTKFSQGYDELYFSYKVKFSDGFTNRSLHGKLPGLSGGTSNGGGNLPTGKDGWSARYMFHGTAINFYLYYPDVYKLSGDAKPIPGKKYYGRGPVLNPGFTLKTGVWYTVTQRIVMNTPGKSDGLVEGYINGKLCAVQTGLRFRDISSLKIDRIYFANFFGGSGVPPSKTETISFDDFVVYTYKPSVSIARNNVPNPAGTVIEIPGL